MDIYAYNLTPDHTPPPPPHTHTSTGVSQWIWKTSGSQLKGLCLWQ